MEIREQFYIARMLCFCFHVFFCLSADLSELSTKLDETFRRLGYVTSNSWLDFCGDSDYDEDTGIFKRDFPT